MTPAFVSGDSSPRVAKVVSGRCQACARANERRAARVEN
jgi:hypothetical protein